MKKPFYLFVALTFFSANIIAQEGGFQNTISIGPRLGLNWSNLAGSEMSSSARMTPTFGAMFLYSRHNNWGLAADFLYAPMGANFRIDDNGNGTRELSTQLHYLHLPMQFVYFFDIGINNIRPKVGAGPYVSFLLNSSNHIDGTSVDLGRDYSTWDLGLNGTVGFNFLITPRIWLNTDLRYAHGFINVDNIAPDNLNNRNLSLMLGLGFSLGN
jgi:hypothetical protein